MGWLTNRKLKKIERLEQDIKSADLALRTYDKVKAFYSGGSRYSSSLVTTGEKYPGGLSNSGMTRLFDHQALRRNTRDAMYDSVEGRGIATRFADTIADTGLRCRFEPKTDLLGISQEEGVKWGKDVSSRFNLFLGSRQFSASETQNGFQMQWLYAFSQQRDNDIYARLYYDYGKDRISPLSVQLIDPDQLDGCAYTSTDGYSQEMTGGIERDARGRELRYKFSYLKKDGTYDTIVVPKRGPKSGKVYMLHGFRPEFAGQGQGFPLYSHLLQKLEDITTLHTSHIQKAINQSSYGFVIEPGDNPASGAIGDMASDGVDVIREFFGDEATDALSDEEVQKLTAQVFPEVTVKQPGSLWYTGLNSKEKLKAVEQNTPSETFPDFVASIMSYASSSSGMPLEVLLMKFGQNFSASRATLVLLWRVINMWRAEMVSDFLGPIKEAWLSEEIAAGNITAPGWLDPKIREAWLNARWIGTREPDIDPLKSANASLVRSILGHETLDDGALNYNGSDGVANRLKLKTEAEESVIGPWSPNFGKGVNTDGRIDDSSVPEEPVDEGSD